ncbi:MAG: DUF4783 domain-containing protein [Bacteroidales bacterium]|jgi:hypothetical protein|nr:DUF4783 domain-containing protein [Bacteroidales bacterium]MBQ5539139.1 DUF4783 domain-containing protein [Bacteroidales bacterium]
MKRAFYLFVFGVILAACFLFEFNTDNTYQKINTAISEGRAENLAVYFAPQMELNFNNSQNICTKTQAVQVLERFFELNRPSQYTSSRNRNYFFGTMKTSEGKSYKVDYTLKTVNNQPVITGLYVY